MQNVASFVIGKGHEPQGEQTEIFHVRPETGKDGDQNSQPRRLIVPSGGNGLKKVQFVGNVPFVDRVIVGDTVLLTLTNGCVAGVTFFCLVRSTIILVCTIGASVVGSVAVGAIRLQGGHGQIQARAGFKFGVAIHGAFFAFDGIAIVLLTDKGASVIQTAQRYLAKARGTRQGVLKDCAHAIRVAVDSDQTSVYSGTIIGFHRLVPGTHSRRPPLQIRSDTGTLRRKSSVVVAALDTTTAAGGLLGRLCHNNAGSVG